MSADKQYPTDPAGELDAGADDVRILLCTLRPWCVLQHLHDGKCVEVVRPALERPDWDKRTPDPRGWTERKRYR